MMSVYRKERILPSAAWGLFVLTEIQNNPSTVTASGIQDNSRYSRRTSSVDSRSDITAFSKRSVSVYSNDGSCVSMDRSRSEQSKENATVTDHGNANREEKDIPPTQEFPNESSVFDVVTPPTEQPVHPYQCDTSTTTGPSKIAIEKNILSLLDVSITQEKTNNIIDLSSNPTYSQYNQLLHPEVVSPGNPSVTNHAEFLPTQPQYNQILIPEVAVLSHPSVITHTLSLLDQDEHVHSVKRVRYTRGELLQLNNPAAFDYQTVQLGEFASKRVTQIRENTNRKIRREIGYGVSELYLTYPSREPKQPPSNTHTKGFNPGVPRSISIMRICYCKYNL
ncbi:hypothetical protein BDB01DRAFT_900126 [Pilobolus umbonatus]|nr:hypothetical protein BDB01DRAFT_900126 [Pilobolus umbonatus]